MLFLKYFLSVIDLGLTFFPESLLGKAVVLSIAIIDSIQLRALAILRLSAIQVTKAP